MPRRSRNAGALRQRLALRRHRRLLQLATTMRWQLSTLRSLPAEGVAGVPAPRLAAVS